jgi:uncharacterized protein (DUF983 family)
MKLGACARCPACGQGKLFRSYLSVATACDHCGQDFTGHRADDAPPYFTIFVVGHIIVGGALALEQKFHPETWVHLALWLPLTVLLSLLLLPPIKGALIGLQWANRMHGFSPDPDPALPRPAPVPREQP